MDINEYEIEYTERGRPQRSSKKEAAFAVTKALKPRIAAKLQKQSKNAQSQTHDSRQSLVSSDAETSSEESKASDEITALPPKKRALTRTANGNSTDKDNNEESSKKQTPSKSTNQPKTKRRSSSETKSNAQTNGTRSRKRHMEVGDNIGVAKKRRKLEPKHKSDETDDSDSESSVSTTESVSKPPAPARGRRKRTPLPTSDDMPGGYIPIEKNIYVNRKERHLKSDDIPICNCTLQPGQTVGCTENCVNRLLYIECLEGYCPCGDKCSNRRLQERAYAPIAPFKAGGKGWGIKALEKIHKGDFIIEYVGEVIDADELEIRMRKYKNDRHFYFLTLVGSECIDASRKGNWARFINHSCNPNCVTQKWQIDAEIRVGIFAVRDIEPGEELTFDYKFERFGPKKQRCLCGEENCCMYLGGKPIKPAPTQSQPQALNGPRGRSRISNLTAQVTRVLKGQKLSPTNFVVDVTPVFRNHKQASGKANSSETTTDQTLQTSKDESSDDDNNTFLGDTQTTRSKSCIFLKRNAEATRYGILARYQRFVYGSLEWVYAEEKRKEAERALAAEKKRQAAWMHWNVPIERLVRKGVVVMEDSGAIKSQQHGKAIDNEAANQNQAVKA